MKALIHEGKVTDVQENPFEVHKDFVWIDCDNTVEVGDFYDGVNFISYKPSQEDVAAAAQQIADREAVKASGYQKLIDLGLTAEEASALARYTPPTE